MSDPIALRIDGHVATIVIDRPRAVNAIDEDVLAGLADAMVAVAAEDRVKVLVITGTGELFCAGLDIDLLGRAFDDHAYFLDVLTRYRDVLLSVERLPVPVVAAVNGLTRAGGFELMLACDIVVTAREARIGDTHTTFGILPGGGATARAPRRLGWQRAADLLLTGRWITGAEAVDLGLASRSVPRADLAATVTALTDGFAPLSRAAIAATKAAMRDGLALPLEAAVDLEIERFAAFLKDEPTAREGYDAFREKREPRW
jgi:enoyl-CoA hydratase/carnithine racemase